MTEEITLGTKQIAEISLYMFEQYRKEFYTPGKHHAASLARGFLIALYAPLLS